MKLNEMQKQLVVQWVEQGLKIAEIQTRIFSEFNLTLTYMDVRFLVDDLKLVPKDSEQIKDPALTPPPPTTAAISTPVHDLDALPAPVTDATVSVLVDQIARPGALVSGKVTFSDGQNADWSLDQMGRLGMAAQQKGYRPNQADLLSFQQALQSELRKLGF